MLAQCITPFSVSRAAIVPCAIESLALVGGWILTMTITRWLFGDFSVIAATALFLVGWTVGGYAGQQTTSNNHRLNSKEMTNGRR